MPYFYLLKDVCFLKKTKTRVNDDIIAFEVFVINSDGNPVGVCKIAQALQIAKDQDLDLVEISPHAKPPVCKILDYGKYKYEMSKKARTMQKKKHELKEIRMQTKISEHDLAFKTKHVQQFLEDGNPVKVTVRFRGRELAYTELGENVLITIQGMLEEAQCKFGVDKKPTMEGRMMSMMLSPRSKK